MKVFVVALLMSVAALAACSSNDPIDAASTTTTAQVPGAQPGPETAADLAVLFREAVNTRDTGVVIALAPDTNDSIADFLIGGGPYATVSCDRFAGKDECHMANGIADFSFIVDVTSGLVSEVTYVGGE